MTQLRAIVDKLLTGVSSAYIPEGCIAEEIFPNIKSKQLSGLLGKYGTSHLRIENSIAGGKGKFRRVESIVRSTTTFVIESHGLEGLVTDDDYKNVEDPFDAEKDETMGISTILQLEKEYGLASQLLNTATVTQNVTLSGGSQFNDYLNSDPLSQFLLAKKSVKNGCGKKVNTVIMDDMVAETLRYHPQMLDALGFKFARPGGLSDEDLAKAIGVDRVLVADCEYESAKEGQTSSLLPVWGKGIIFMVAPDKAVPYQISAGYMITPEGDSPRQVFKQPVFNPPGATEILVRDRYDMLLSNLGAIYLIANAIA